LKILFIRFSAIGDIVLSTSPLKTLKNAFPDSQIHFLTLEEHGPLLEGNSDINRLLLIEKSASILQLYLTGNYLKNRNYDLIIDMHNSLRSKILRSLIHASSIFYLKKPRWKRFKLFDFHINSFEKDFSQLKLFHSTFDGLISNEKTSGTSLFVSPSEKQQSLELLKNNGLKNQKYIVCIPGAAWINKAWNTDNYLDVFQFIYSKNLSVVLLGSRSDKICQECYQKDHSLVNMAGLTHFRESMAIISQSQLVLGSDTGFVHSAEALGIPSIMLLGPTSTETGAGVTKPESTNIQHPNLWCRPCSQNGSRDCYRTHKFCMDYITPYQVINELRNSYGLS
jgi:ADP-heptose:LPS heptosyltransferase